MQTAEKLAQPSAQHTPTPYFIGSENRIFAQDGIPVCRMGGNVTQLNCEPNAAFIVRACNSHDALLAALRETVARLQRTDKLLCEKTGHTAAYELGEVIRARAAIAAAEGAV